MQPDNVLTFPSDDEGPSAMDAIEQVVAAEGNLDWAAERLFGHQEGIHAKARLIALLAEDVSAQRELQRILRTLTMLQAFQTFKLTAEVVEGTLDRIDANQRANFLNKMAGTIAILTDDHVQTTNSNSTSLSVALSEQVLKSLDPKVQEAIRVLNAPVEAEDVVDANWSLGAPPPNAAVAAEGQDHDVTRDRDG